ncbi:hypothetical protein FGG08_004662 [Glutinoglossum americanum]|uniref:Uncharacterized protein n=1 Tax=Glutinoglossum americanum TaxID=1670608 RepID=A0A9P8I1W8_9PEZI|nr:hypothetical protein FGG08_004662 [Glutinoglossum americanum]
MCTGASVTKAISKSRDIISPGCKSPNGFNAEGLMLVDTFWTYFWRQDRRVFAAKYSSAETIIALEAVVEAEQSAQGRYTKKLTAAFNAVERYKNPRYGAYCAWHNFAGNDDIYFDDNAQVAIAQIAAYRLTQEEVYLERAREVIRFIRTGWDHYRGGVRWHLRTSGPPYTSRNTCSTVLTALACLRLAQLGAIDEQLRQSSISFAEKAVHWTIDGLKSDECLIMDGFSEHDGCFRIDRTTYTYNTGMTILALSLIYSMRPSDQIRLWAIELATAAVDHSKGLFDLSVRNTEVRYWWDSTFFTHLLVEGLLAFLDVFGQDIDAQLTSRIASEVRREMKYMVDYLKDKSDGLYFRNLRLYVIGDTQLSQYKLLTGDENRELRADGSERVDGSKEAADRKLTKTLLGNGGAARGLLIAARLEDDRSFK